MARAVANGAATKGLVRSRQLLIKNADRDVDAPVRAFRDRERERLARMAATGPDGMAAILQRELRRAEQDDAMATRKRPEPPAYTEPNDPESNEHLLGRKRR
jgi:hypothetical protein